MITCYFGLPRCGKSTIVAKYARREIKRIKAGRSKYKRVFTNYAVDGAEVIRWGELPYYDLKDSLILWDEITIDADNRDFANFSKAHIKFFVLHGHQKLDFIYFTQQVNAVDVKIRRLTEQVYYVTRGRFVSKAVNIPREIIIPQETGEIIDGYVEPGLLARIFAKRTLRPRWYKYFDSWTMDEMLREKKPTYWSFKRN